jgi:glyoxylase-like metal-dependent hydrolase (beta-lactamase superfamily II)
MMKIGQYTLDPVETGRFALDGGAMFGVVPKPLWSRSNPPDDRNRITLAARSLLLRDGRRTILIDNGNGPKFTEKLRDIYRLEDSASNLGLSLAALGVKPQDVTDVLLTHLHFDHAGGSTAIVNGRAVPAFPNARYYVQGAHWAQAMNPTPKDRASFFPDDYMPLKEAGVLEFTDGEGEIFPGIRVLVTNGHTTAQQLPLISDGATSLLFTCDLLPTTAHIPLPYAMTYDLRPLVTLEEKRSILERASAERWILFFEHDPETVACTVAKGAKGVAFEAAVSLT